MRRFYRSCPTCHRRMRRIGTSSQVFGEPPTPFELYYCCPRCEAEWTFNARRNLYSPSVPAHLAQDGDA
jgi:hypothetical protein